MSLHRPFVVLYILPTMGPQSCQWGTNGNAGTDARARETNGAARRAGREERLTGHNGLDRLGHLIQMARPRVRLTLQLEDMRKKGLRM